MDPYNALIQASLTGDVRHLHHLLSQDHLLLDKFLVPTDPAHDTPLHTAALAGHVDFVAALLDRKPEMGRVPNGQGLLPIHLASARGHVGVVKKMVELDRKLCLVGDNEGRTPLHIAAAANKVGVMEALIAVDARLVDVVSTGLGETILHSSVKHNQMEAVKFILGRHKELVHAKDYNGDTVLHVAVARRNSWAVNYLLEKTSINVNEENYQGSTAFDMALQPDMDFSRLLLDRGARKGQRNIIEPDAAKTPNELALGKKAQKVAEDMERLKDIQNTIIIVSTLIAGAAYTTGLKEEAIDGTYHSWFNLFNSASLGTSMAIILILASGATVKRYITTRLLLIILWVSLLCMALSFGIATINNKKTKHSRKVSSGFLIGTVGLMGIMFLHHIVQLLKSHDKDEKLEAAAKKAKRELAKMEKPH